VPTRLCPLTGHGCPVMPPGACFLTFTATDSHRSVTGMTFTGLAPMVGDLPEPFTGRLRLE